MFQLHCSLFTVPKKKMAHGPCLDDDYISLDGSEDESVGDIDDNWLESEDPEPTEEELERERKKKARILANALPKIAVVHKPQYILDNIDLFYALCEVDDWGFADFPDELQMEVCVNRYMNMYTLLS